MRVRFSPRVHEKKRNNLYAMKCEKCGYVIDPCWNKKDVKQCMLDIE
jgi:uncharacterized OB-fold protein